MIKKLSDIIWWPLHIDSNSRPTYFLCGDRFYNVSVTSRPSTEKCRVFEIYGRQDEDFLFIYLYLFIFKLATLPGYPSPNFNGAMQVHGRKMCTKHWRQGIRLYRE